MPSNRGRNVTRNVGGRRAASRNQETPEGSRQSRSTPETNKRRWSMPESNRGRRATPENNRNRITGEHQTIIAEMWSKQVLEKMMTKLICM